MKIIAALILSMPAWATNAPNVTSIAATSHDGQTFVTWTDAATSTSGQKYRYDVYRATSCPIASLGAATKIQSLVLNNSGQQTTNGVGTFTQAQRIDVGNAMSIIANGGSALAEWTGLAVHRNSGTATACYAVITHDNTGSETDSPISAGNNSMAGTVNETAASVFLPVVQIPYTTPGRDPTNYGFTGNPNLPFWIYLHASSGGGNPGVGDYWQYWADSTMGFQEGIPNVFSVYDDHASVMRYGAETIIATPQADAWIVDGTGGTETLWFGYKDSSNGFAEPYWENQLLWLISFTESNYAAQIDLNQVYGDGESMGAWGNASFSLRHPEIYAAVFADMPRFKCCGGTSGIADDTSTSLISGVGLTMPDGTTVYSTRMNMVTYATPCTATMPPIIWGVGKLDAISVWPDQVEMVNALKACRYGFAMQWKNEGHVGNEYSTLRPEYQGSVYRKNKAYPAFTNFSLDGNIGDGDPNTADPAGCINCGWSWTTVSESAVSWASTITNSQIITTATVDVTPRNSQTFTPPTGTPIAWIASTGGTGAGTIDAHGLITAEGVSIAAAGTTITFTVTSGGSTIGGKSTFGGKSAQ